MTWFYIMLNAMDASRVLGRARMDLIRPRRLKSGDRIGIIAPASPVHVIDQRAWERGLANLRAIGLEPVFGKNLMKRTGHTAGTPQERADDIMDMFRSPDIAAIITVFGGFNSNQVLDLLDYDEIERNAKVFCGYSDITTLNLAFLERSRMVNFSGPALVTFCQPELPAYTLDSFRSAVFGTGEHVIVPSENWAEDEWFLKPELGPREWKPNPGWAVIGEGVESGPSIGGNLSTLLGLAGTDYWPEMHGRILFVEEDDTGPAGLIDRNLQQLKMLGVLDEISALVVGRISTRAGFDENDRLEDCVRRLTEGYDMPVVTGVDLSHTDPIATLPLGVLCELDTETKRIRFLEPSVD